MKIFNNWRQTLIFLSVTEVTHEQRQGSALHCRNLPCPLPGPDPAASSPSPCHWELLMYQGHGCTATENLVLPFLSSHPETRRQPALAHAAFAGARVAASQRFCASLSPFLIHHFSACFFFFFFPQITFATALALMASWMQMLIRGGASRWYGSSTRNSNRNRDSSRLQSPDCWGKGGQRRSAS